jgi:hypothetical protein
MTCTSVHRRRRRSRPFASFDLGELVAVDGPAVVLGVAVIGRILPGLRVDPADADTARFARESDDLVIHGGFREATPGDEVFPLGGDDASELRRRHLEVLDTHVETRLDSLDLGFVKVGERCGSLPTRVNRGVEGLGRDFSYSHGVNTNSHFASIIYK